MKVAALTTLDTKGCSLIQQAAAGQMSPATALYLTVGWTRSKAGGWEGP